MGVFRFGQLRSGHMMRLTSTSISITVVLAACAGQTADAPMDAAVCPSIDAAPAPIPTCATWSPDLVRTDEHVREWTIPAGQCAAAICVETAIYEEPESLPPRLHFTGESGPRLDLVEIQPRLWCAQWADLREYPLGDQETRWAIVGPLGELRVTVEL